MKKKKRLGFPRASAALLGLGVAGLASPAMAVVGTAPILISGTTSITHAPNPIVDPNVTLGPPVTKTYTVIGAGGLDGVASLDLGAVPSTGSVYNDGVLPLKGSSTAKGGLDQTTVTGILGSAGLKFPSGMGITQTDTGSFSGNTSTLTLNFDLTWNVSDGWTGPISVAQSLLVSLKTTGVGDIASVTGTFKYDLDLNTASSPGVDFTKTITYSGIKNDGLNTTVNKTLYVSGVLDPGSVPVTDLGANDLNTNTLRLTGSIVFSALDPAGPTGVEIINDPNLFTNSLLSLSQSSSLHALSQQNGQPFTDANQLIALFGGQDQGGVAGAFLAGEFSGEGSLSITQSETPNEPVGIPEPGSLALLGGASLMLARFRRTRVRGGG